MSLTVDTSRVKAQLSEFIGRVAFGRERVPVLRRDKPVAALVSVEDLRRLEVSAATPGKPKDTPTMHPIAFTRGLPLVTHSRAHFDRIPGLALTDWLA